MQGLVLEMLVDHYPLRNAVRAGYDGNLELHSMKLLAEAMAGSEVLLLVAGDSTEENLKPLTFQLQGKTFLIAGTSLEYSDATFVQYLSDRVVDAPMMMHQIDARNLVLLAIGLGDVDGILFDMEIEGKSEDSFDRALLNSMLLINDTTRQAIVRLDDLMESESGEGGFHTLPSAVLSLLAREEDPDERRKTLLGYLSHRSHYELGKTVLFVAGDEDSSGDAYTTLARGIYERMVAALESGSSQYEQTFVPVTAFEWLSGLAQSGVKRVRLDGNTTVSGRFARGVLGSGNAELS
jgi:hypothetical protein